MAFRTDLAMEAAERASAGALAGVKSRVRREEGVTVIEVEILDRRGEEALGKPRGRYLTLETGRITPEALPRLAAAAASALREMMAQLGLTPETPVLVAGLGNRTVTPDSIGPLAAERVLVTRHLLGEKKRLFEGLRPVSAVIPGVLGVTGIESAELVAGAVRAARPGLVIALDALAAGSIRRVCRTVQLASGGIAPGSGVDNARAALSEAGLGVPVIAVGVPTVVDADTLCRELAGERAAERFFVTPREIDREAAMAAKLLGYAVNMALQPLSFAEVAEYVE